MRKFFDLRFVIGIFFLAIGLLLLIHSLMGATAVEFIAHVNLYSSFVFYCICGLHVDSFAG